MSTSVIIKIIDWPELLEEMDVVRSRIHFFRPFLTLSYLLDCGNFFNPFTGFESDGNECEGFGGLQCAGNPDESCGSTEGDFLNIYFNTAANTCVLWPGGASLTSGSWRLIFPYKLSSSIFSLLMSQLATSTKRHCWCESFAT